jgi:uroporphyrinogen-III synthase
MSRPLALLRPEPGWSASAAAAREAGIAVIGHPLFVAEPVAWSVPAGRFDAMLVGSANAFRLGGDGLAELRHLPVHAVGEATATAARAAGFTVARTGEGGLQTLLDDLATEAQDILRLAGEERVTLRPDTGQALTEIMVYRMAPCPLRPDFAGLLTASRPIVALHSAAAAAHFAQEAERLGLARGELFLLVLGPRVAKSAGLGWAAVHIAERPSDAALLAKAGALCK